ncbi:MAG TPA: Rieske 2Fe-2S domain-containing protein [Dehalococcoidia bacterium]|nr:Rieske 2Fe-2S domain-containing protein [Dehalococcoidia bacterium]
MLSKEDNELLCRVGPGTPMGNMFREYWLPAIRSDELPAPDCPPLRVRLLGENLIGYRTTSGAVGLMQDACPHRGASMFFGRNEEEGLRCVYHGWKFDVTGACVDMPSEPAESNFKNKVRARAYATYERGGIIWAYMGPREVPPPLPHMEANILNTDPEHISVLHRKCNWMQGLEGELDTIHAAFLHWGADRAEDQAPKSFLYYHFKHRAEAHFVAKDTDFGAAYGAYRPAEEDTFYWRIGYVFFPFYAMQAQGEMGPDCKMNAYVPLDDEHTLQWEIFIRTEGTEPRPQRKVPINRTSEPIPTGRGGSGGGHYVPQTTDWLGRFNLVQNLENDYLVDREAQSTWKSYSGIPGIRQQDMAVTETMGPIYNRSREHLGTSDSLIIRTRRNWIKAALAHRDQGILPPGVDNPQMYRIRSGEVILPRSVDWWEGSTSLREKFSAEADRLLEAAAPLEVPASGS